MGCSLSNDVSKSHAAAVNIDSFASRNPLASLQTDAAGTTATVSDPERVRSSSRVCSRVRRQRGPRHRPSSPTNGARRDGSAREGQAGTTGAQTPRHRRHREDLFPRKWTRRNSGGAMTTTATANTPPAAEPSHAALYSSLSLTTSFRSFERDPAPDGRRSNK